LFTLTPSSTTHIYPLSLHDALPISRAPKDIKHNSGHSGTDQFFMRTEDANGHARNLLRRRATPERRDTHSFLSRIQPPADSFGRDRKSTRLNSSHLVISYAVFCLKK